MADDPTADWRGDWDEVGRVQRQAWRETTPDERLRWLEDALRFAMEAGALQRDRAGRAAKAQRWPDDGGTG
jgi:hypothetical protein